MCTSSPTTANGPMLTPAATRANGATMAVGWMPDAIVVRSSNRAAAFANATFGCACRNSVFPRRSLHRLQLRTLRPMRWRAPRSSSHPHRSDRAARPVPARRRRGAQPRRHLRREPQYRPLIPVLSCAFRSPTRSSKFLLHWHFNLKNHTAPLRPSVASSNARAPIPTVRGTREQSTRSLV